MSSPDTAWRESVQRFVDDVADLMVTGDTRISRVASIEDAGVVIRDRAAAVHRRVWNMQYSLPLTTLDAHSGTDAEARERGVEERDLVPAAALRQNPLLPNLTLDLRLGWVPTPMLLSDDDHVFLPGPPGTPHQWTIWESTDEEVVARAHAAYVACWDHARPWREHTDRPLLSERLLAVALRLADGQSDRDIADGLGVGLRTASGEVRRVIDWCGARSRGHAIAVLVGADH